MSEGYRALRGGVAWLDVSPRGRILARGRDRARFLHNVTSNEVKKLAPGEGCYAFLLSPQGRIQADAALFCFEDHFLIETEPELTAKVFNHIRRYIVADQVELEDAAATLGAVALEGPSAQSVLAALGAPVPTAPYAHQPWGAYTIAAAAITGQPGFRIFCPRGDLTSLAQRFEQAGAVPATAEDFRVARVENGIPRGGEDIIEASLAQETGRMEAVSFSKGCYLGQEIVERVRARGHVNRELKLVKLPGAEPAAAGSTIDAEGKPAEVTSSVFSPLHGCAVALAYVRV